MIIKAYKYRLLLKTSQRTQLKRVVIRCTRTYSHVIAYAMDELRTGGSLPSFFDLCNVVTNLRRSDEALQAVNSQVLQNVAHKAHTHLVETVIRKRKSLMTKAELNSITYPQFGKGCRLKSKGIIYLDKIGELPFKVTREIEGKIKTVTIKEEALDKWYVIFTAQQEEQPEPARGEVNSFSDRSVGIDFGIKAFVTLSNGKTFVYPSEIEATRKELFKTLGLLTNSKDKTRRAKLKTKMLHLKEKYRCAVDDYIKKLCKDLVQDYDFFAVEDINKTGMAKGKGLGTKVKFAPWKKFSEQLRLLCRERGLGFVYISSVNTSRECVGCGNIKEKLMLSERTYSCTECGISLDRDVNAAKVILKRAQA